MLRHPEQVRLLAPSDLTAIVHLLSASDYIYQRFTLDELKHILKTYPAVGLFRGDSLRSFLLSQTVNPPSAWIGGFGISWTDSRAYLRFLDLQLQMLDEQLGERGVEALYYSGNDLQNDWLREPLQQRGFALYRRLYAYDKFDYATPTQGNQEITVRPAELSDIPVLLSLEELCFEQIWRYDDLSLADIIRTHPYFVVAELQGQVVGYQFNALDGGYGYLVRIAVHPAYNGRGIGARLMAEAVRFFQRVHATHIMLNTQEENTHAHRLYEWFGFVRIQQIGFVLRHEL